MKPRELARGALRLLGNTLYGILRGIGWAFLIVVLCLGGFGYYAYRHFSPDDAKLLAAEQLTALLHREVTIEHMVLSPRGLKVLGVRVRRGRVGVDGDLLTCGSALVTFKLRPLLERRLELETVVLQSPQINLSRDEQGNWSVADVFGSSAGARGPLMPVAFEAASTEIEDGVVRVDDRMRGRKLSLEKVSLRVDAFNLQKVFPITADFVTSDTFGGRSVTASVGVKGSVDLAGMRWSSATATADRFRIQTEGVTLTGHGEVVDFATPRIAVEISAPSVGPDLWPRLFGRELALSLPPTSWSIKAEMPASGMLDFEKITAATPAGRATATGLIDFGGDNPNLSVELNASDADLAQIAVWAPALAAHELKGKATLRASVTGWAGRLQAREADLGLRDFSGVWSGRRIDGADIDASATDDFAQLKATATKGTVTAIGNVFEEIAGAVAFDKQNVTIERLAMKWGGSRVRLRARLVRRTAPAPNQVELSGSVDKLDWDAGAKLWADIRSAISTRPATADGDEERPWLRTFKYSIPRGFPDTTGHVRVGEVSHPNFNCKDLELMWSIRDVTPALDKVSGEARLSFGPGRVNDIQALQDANKFLHVVFLPFIYMYKMNKFAQFSTATAYPKTLDFRRIDGEYGASRGVATTRYFHVDSDQLVAYAQGDADFGREKVDMNVLTRLGGYSGTLPLWWVDEKGRPAIGFRVKGDILKPDLEPRFNKIGEDEIENDVEQGRADAHKRFENLEKLQTF
jgi:hypothetical protein